MEKALVAVERPILVISIPNQFELVFGRPKYSIKIRNVGKQVANTNAINAAMIIQRDSNFPAAVDPNDGSGCTIIPVLGQRVIIPAGEIEISCQRQLALTPGQVENVIRSSSYAFFRVEIIYDDSIGNSRIATWVALLRISNDVGRFVQIFSGEGSRQTETNEEQEAIQRALIDTILKIEKDRGYPFPDE